MILGHLKGLYTNPKQEWRTIENNHEGSSNSIFHIIAIALIPAICAYIANAHIGWNIGVGDPLLLTANSALIISISMYFGLIFGVFALAYLIFWMATTFDSVPTYTQAIELASYTATPLFMVGFVMLYPVIWVDMLVGLAGLTYSVYLLYTGVPILMKIPEEKGFIYASSVVTAGLVLLVAIMAASVILWSIGFGPQYL